jgi:hypothetical protein
LVLEGEAVESIVGRDYDGKFIRYTSIQLAMLVEIDNRIRLIHCGCLVAIDNELLLSTLTMCPAIAERWPAQVSKTGLPKLQILAY